VSSDPSSLRSGGNAAAFLAAGAAAVGIGSALTRMSASERRTFVAAVKAIP
jgi:2-keto-3-deoxy-6-phosphogluconate aldolase